MPTTEELKKEIARLRKIKAQRGKDFLDMHKKRNKALLLLKKQQLERRTLERELADLKNPRSTAFRQNVKRAGKLGLKAILLIGEDIDKRIRARRGR